MAAIFQESVVSLPMLAASLTSKLPIAAMGLAGRSRRTFLRTKVSFSCKACSAR